MAREAQMLFALSDSKAAAFEDFKLPNCTTLHQVSAFGKTAEETAPRSGRVSFSTEISLNDTDDCLLFHPDC